MRKVFGAGISNLVRERKRSALFGGSKLELGLVFDYLKIKCGAPSPPKPRMIQIEPTRRCNLDCTMCLRRSGESASSMGIDFFKRIISRDFAYPHFLLLYGQGEPFLAGDLFEMIRYERSRGNFVTTVTNGTIIDREVCREIVRSGLNVLRVSLDGAGEETYNGIRRGADFNRVIGNIEFLSQFLRSAGSRTRLALTFMALRSNYRDMPRMVRLASRMGIRYLEIKDLPPYADSPVKPLAVEMEEDGHLGEDIERTVSETKEAARTAGVGVVMTKFHCLNRNGRCLNPWFKTFITWDGKVKACSKLFAPSSEAMGDLGESTFDDIWNGHLYACVRKSVREDLVPFEECRRIF
jgi:MoaA/NifB/PqqE/SkfB family radical SAM enzyme